MRPTSRRYYAWTTWVTSCAILGSSACPPALGQGRSASDGIPPPVARNIVYDDLQRVIGSSGRREIPCPEQDGETAVFLILGQSNAANYATHAYRSRHGQAVINSFEGRCYLASSPLLGSSGPWGEYWTELGNRLVASRRYRRIILVSSAIGGSSINQWQANGRLNAMLTNVISQTQRRYAITHVFWHQGESDTDMPADQYRQGFLSLVTTLRSHGVAAPVFVSVTSARRGENPPVVQAQRSLPDPALGIFPGVDTDELVEPGERNSTGHFGPQAQVKVVDAWLQILSAGRRTGSQ